MEEVERSRQKNGSMPAIDAAGVAARVPIAQVMTTHVVTVTPDIAIETARGLLLQRGISGMPVVDEDGHVIGMLSKTDLLAEDEEHEGDIAEYEDVPRRGRLDYPGTVRRMTRATVGDVMTPITVTISQDASLARAAALMVAEGIHRLVVVDAQGRVNGLLSAMDVLRWLARGA